MNISNSSNLPCPFRQTQAFHLLHVISIFPRKSHRAAPEPFLVLTSGSHHPTSVSSPKKESRSARRFELFFQPPQRLQRNCNGLQKWPSPPIQKPTFRAAHATRDLDRFCTRELFLFEAGPKSGIFASFFFPKPLKVARGVKLLIGLGGELNACFFWGSLRWFLDEKLEEKLIFCKTPLNR